MKLRSKATYFVAVVSVLTACTDSDRELASRTSDGTRTISSLPSVTAGSAAKTEDAAKAMRSRPSPNPDARVASSATVAAPSKSEFRYRPDPRLRQQMKKTPGH